MSEKNTKDPDTVGDVVDGLDELGKDEKDVRVADVLDKFGNRSFAPVMLVLALLEISPVGVIPGVPTFLAICVALVAVQLLIGREHIWVPNWVAQRSVSGEKMEKATDKLGGIAEKLDKIAKGRLKALATGPALQFTAGIILLLCLMVPPLEVLPWASAAPMFAISIICLAIMVGDGLAMLIAWLLAGAAIIGLGYWYSTSGSSGGGILPF